jgi:olefin beta-lactone synthetase
MAERDPNIASALTRMAGKQPHVTAIYHPLGRGRGGLGRGFVGRGRQRYAEVSYRELDDDSTRIARGLGRMGLLPGARVALMVRPSPELFALTFALFKAGVVPVMIDPGIGVRALGRCLDEASPEGFIGIAEAHLARIALGWGRRTVRTLVTVGRRGPWGGATLDDVRNAGLLGESAAPSVGEGDAVAILFTSGSTGAPKGALYTHGNFAAQVELLQRTFAFEPGEIDLPTFPLFALFDPALGMTTVLPYMDPTRPAQVDPREILEPVAAFGVSNMFGSPALLRRVGFSDEARGVKLSTLRRVISAGAPVPAPVIERFLALLPAGAQIFTPYGATEALPVAVAGSDALLGAARGQTDRGAGVCVGRPVEGVRVEIIGIDDAPIDRWTDALRSAPGEIGEICVSGPNVTRAYFGRDEATRLAKIAGPGEGQVFHRMGDVGYVDPSGSLWYCGRKSHRVKTASGTLFTEPCEAVFNTHPRVARSALVGVQRKRKGDTLPVLCVEPTGRLGPLGRRSLRRELLALGAGHEHTRGITHILFHPSFPVDIRHNAKIFREKLAAWAAGEL